MNAHPCRASRRVFLKTASISPLFLAKIVKAEAAANTGNNAQGAKAEELETVLAAIRQESGIPAIAAAAMKDGRLLTSAAVGLRKVGASATVTISDRFHIGSCTKAMTSSLAAMVVQQGKMHWDSTLSEVFPERADQMHISYRKVTLEWLLTHLSGAPANSNNYGRRRDSAQSQRLAYMDSVIGKPSVSEPGTVFAYSNAGYIIAGAMLERVTRQNWEALIQQKLFRPLGMASAGFGPPSKPNATDQPWGHVLNQGKFEPRFGDNPRALGPAGTVHCTVPDYLKFADWHTSGGNRPIGLLPSGCFGRLHQPPPKQEYAMGWGVVERGWAKGVALTHAGSNTMNYFVVWLAPKIGLSLAVAANAAGENVPQALDRVASMLVRKFAS